MPDFLIDDRFIISKDIKKMSKEELDKEIERLENENKIKKATQRKNEKNGIAV